MERMPSVRYHSFLCGALLLLICLLSWFWWKGPFRQGHVFSTSSVPTLTAPVASPVSSPFEKLHPARTITQFGNWTLATFSEFAERMVRVPAEAILTPLHRLPLNFPHGMRVLYIINSYNLGQFSHLQRMLRNIAEMCEFGWNIDVVFHTAATFKRWVHRSIQSALFCTRIKQPVTYSIEQFPRKINVWISVEHRRVMAQKLETHDFFIYTEDDLDITLGHVLMYLWELLFLPPMTVPGFLRWNEWNNTFTACEWEADMRHIHIKSLNGRSYWIPNNPHQGFFMLTYRQIKWAAEFCDFFHTRPAHNESLVREVMSSWQLVYQGPIREVKSCKLLKHIPIHNYPYFRKFTIHHLSNNHGDNQLTMDEVFGITRLCADTGVKNFSHSVGSGPSTLFVHQTKCRSNASHPPLF